MTYVLRKNAPSYKAHSPNQIVVMGECESLASAIELLREHFLTINTSIAGHPDVPDIIKSRSRINIKRNAFLDIAVRADGIVFVDGEGPEMDYYTILPKILPDYHAGVWKEDC